MRTEVGRRKLTRLLLAKAALDFVIVVWLAASFASATLTPIEAGRIEKIDGEVRGRFTAKAQHRDADVQLFIDEVFVTSTRVRCEAEDVKADARAASPCEFSFALPPLAAGDHEAAVYVAGADAGEARRSLRIVGEPVRFRVESSETKQADMIR